MNGVAEMTDERLKQLMEQVGMPNSRSLYDALRQAYMEGYQQLEAENKLLRDALEDTDMNRKHAEGSTMIIDSEELVRRMKTFGLKGVRDGSVHFFIKPELLAEFLEAEIRAEREACAKIARQLEAENKRLREALNAIAEGEIYPVQVALAALAATEPPIGDSGILDGSNRTTGGWIGQP